MFNQAQLAKICNPHYNQDYVTIYWNQLQQLDKITEKQWKLLLILADMPKKEQLKYVIIEDKLVEAPTKQRVYTSISGKWKRSKIHEGNTKKG